MHEEYQHVWSCVGFWSKVSDDRGKCCLFFLSGHKNVRTLQITPRTSNSHLVCGLNDKIIDCFWHDFLFIYPATQRVHWLLVNNSIYHYFHSIKSDMHIKLFHCVAYRSMEKYRSTLENWVVYASTHCTLMITMVCEWEKKIRVWLIEYLCYWTELYTIYTYLLTRPPIFLSISISGNCLFHIHIMCPSRQGPSHLIFLNSHP